MQDRCEKCGRVGVPCGNCDIRYLTQADLDAAVAKAVQAEREACAKICEQEANEQRYRVTWKGRLLIAARFIRERGQSWELQSKRGGES